jgi:3-deoxy-D-manno-octulosonic-acid transferase
MRCLYNIGIQFYFLLIKLASIRNEKARKWLEGRKNIYERLRETIVPGDQLLWFHASSLGEFEQGRPVIEAIKKEYTNYKILLTFFSPSGYEVRKNYEYADYVFYLPLDTKKNASLFLDIVKPEKAFFIKYEFWYHFLTELRKHEIPTYIFSALFRSNQIFFKPWGKWYREALQTYRHIFVQNRESADLLHRFGFLNVTVNGDTRLDRVAQIADSAPVLTKMEHFCGKQKSMIAGSTWKEDEELFIRYINDCNANVKYVIAPHEVNPQSLERIATALQKSYTFYSSGTDEELQKAKVLIVDGYGYLVSVYRYGMIAYIGGGFTSGIHSILEPAAYGMPVIFGPNYHKFKEAIDMIELGGAHSVTSYEELQFLIDNYLKDEVKLRQNSEKIGKYVEQNRGASSEIIHYIFG